MKHQQSDTAGLLMLLLFWILLIAGIWFALRIPIPEIDPTLEPEVEARCDSLRLADSLRMQARYDDSFIKRIGRPPQR